MHYQIIHLMIPKYLMSTNTIKMNVIQRKINRMDKVLKKIQNRKKLKIPASIIRDRKKMQKEKASRLPEEKFLKVHIGIKNILNKKVLNHYTEKELEENFCHALTGSYDKCKNKISYIAFNMNEGKKRDKRKKMVPLCKLHANYYNKNDKLPKGFYFECERESFNNKYKIDAKKNAKKQPKETKGKKKTTKNSSKKK